MKKDISFYFTVLRTVLLFFGRAIDLSLPLAILLGAGPNAKGVETVFFQLNGKSWLSRGQHRPLLDGYPTLKE